MSVCIVREVIIIKHNVLNFFFQDFQDKVQFKGITFTYVNISIHQYVRIYCFMKKDKY